MPTNLFVLNGSNIPSGFTFATPNPLYVQGHYNVPDAHYYTGTNATNTAASGAYPASLISDALTILSANWVDSQGTRGADGFPGKNNAASTTVSAAILTGFVPSTGSGATTYSGGIHNLPRLLEDWTTAAQATLTLNTSLVNLYNSARATNQFQNPPAYYDAPARIFSFDPNFLSSWKLPPGTPGVAPASPSFVTFPANQTVAGGGMATFSASAVGLGVLGFQWGFSTSISGPYTNIPDATNASLVISGVSATNVGYYQIMITNASGSISYPASLTLATPPVITSPPADEVLPAGGTASFAVTATGTGPLMYQWLFNGTNLDGATQATLTLTNISDDDAGEYMVVVTNIAGAASNSAALSLALPPTIDPPLANLTILAGQDASFNVTASGTGPLTYQWTFNGTNVLAETDATLSLNNVSLDQAGIYSVIVTNLAGVASNSATLSVYASATATLSALSSFSGGQFQFTVSGVPGFNYVIQASTNFIDWEPLITNTSPFTLTDDDTTNFPARFYRAVYAP